MVTKIESINFKSEDLAVVALSILALIITVQSGGVYASSSDSDNDEVPYCDQVGREYQEACFDSKDYDDATGLAPCKDGSQVPDYRDCPDRED